MTVQPSQKMQKFSTAYKTFLSIEFYVDRQTDRQTDRFTDWLNHWLMLPAVWNLIYRLDVRNCCIYSIHYGMDLHLSSWSLHWQCKMLYISWIKYPLVSAIYRQSYKIPLTFFIDVNNLQLTHMHRFSFLSFIEWCPKVSAIIFIRFLVVDGKKIECITEAV